MSQRSSLLAIALSGLLVVACTDREDESPPAITAQGFEIGDPRQAQPGAFSDVRLRVEAPAGIEHLVVRERSYEIDLARTPETSQFVLFGIERRVWSRHDVTLDLSGYLNAKMRQPGEYAVSLEVSDRAGRRATAVLPVHVAAPAADTTAPEGPEAGERTGADEVRRPSADEHPTRPAGADGTAAGASMQPWSEERSIRLERIGRGPVEGGAPLGLTWKTIDPIAVVIRVSAREEGGGGFARLEPAAWERLNGPEALARMLEGHELADSLEIPTANDAAAGTVFAIVRPEERYLLLTEHSRTRLSELGTTVTLVGRYRR
jgi:hypothetical protein